MKPTLLVTACVSLLWAGALGAQDKPDFSGYAWSFNASLTKEHRWSRVRATGPKSHGRRRWKSSRHFPTRRPDFTRRPVHAGLHLSVRRFRTTSRRAGEITTRRCAHWEGDKLVVVSSAIHRAARGALCRLERGVHARRPQSRRGAHRKRRRGSPRRARSLLQGRLRSPHGRSVTRSVPARRGPSGVCQTVDRIWRATGCRRRDPSWSVEARRPGSGSRGDAAWSSNPPDGKVPYQPWAAAERERRRNDLLNDREPHCFPSASPGRWRSACRTRFCSSTPRCWCSSNMCTRVASSQ